MTFNKDTAYPAVTINSPLNDTYNTNSITFNVTATDGSDIDNCWYSLTEGSVNYSMTETNPPKWDNTNSSMNQGSHTVNYYCNDSYNNINDTEQETFFIDSIYPSITNLIESPSDPATWTSSATYQFNATITDTNLDIVLIEFDNVNYTPTKTEDVYNLTINDLAAGTYNYKWFANDTANNINLTAVQDYTINNASGDITLLINDSASDQSAPYETQTNASATTSYGSVTLYRNETPITSENNDYITLAADYYNYTAVSSGDQNHSSDSITRFVTITKINSEVNLTLNEIDGNVTITQDSSIWLNFTTISGDSEATLKLYNNDSLINQGINPLNNLTTFNVVGLFNITGYYLQSENYTSSSETWWVNVTETPDTEKPSVASLTETPSDPATYSPGQVYEFNATITDNRNIHTVIFEFEGVNYTPTNLSLDVYNVTFTDLSVDTYNYRWYANDTSGNSNNTENGTYTISQEIPSLGLTITPSNNEDYPKQTTANGTGCPSQLICNLYRDGIEVTEPETITLAAETYNYTYNTTGNANYTSASVSDNLTINQATGVVFTYLNNYRANKTLEQYTEIYLNSTLETGQTGENITLYNNGSLIEQGESPLSNLTNFTTIGLYNITTFYDGNENYTSAYETWWVNVTEADVTPPQISVIYPQNDSYNEIQTQLNYTAWDNFGLIDCWYSINNGITNTSITCGENITGLNSGQGSSTWIIWANDAKGNENSSSVTFFVDSINPTIQFVSPTKTSGTSLGRDYIQINVTASDENLENITIRLYNSTRDLIKTNISATSPHFINYTGLLAGTYFFNATANDTLGNNISTETKTIFLVLPNLTIIKPKNKTYLTNTSLLLNYIASYEDYVWYNIDQIGSNTTISVNTTFNTSEGQHTLHLYANNSLGTTTKNVTFTVNLTKFIIYYDEYKGSNKGNSTNFNEYSYTEIQNLSDIIMEHTSHGKISFNQAINLTDDANVSDNEIDLDNNINMSDNRIEINSTALPNFNKSATLYFYGLSLTNPRALRDDSVCPSEICTSPVYSSGTWRFNVTGFTVYSIEETPTEEAPSSDEPGSSGGGGEGSAECLQDSDCKDKDEVCWKYKCVKLFDIKIIDFESPAQLGDFFDFTYFAKGMADINNDVEVRFWVEKNQEVITSGSDIIYFGNFEEKTETTKIFLPSNLESGFYEFYVQIIHEAYTVSSHRSIEIEVKEGGIAIIKILDKEYSKIYLIIVLIIVFLFILFLIHILWKKRLKKKSK